MIALGKQSRQPGKKSFAEQNALRAPRIGDRVKTRCYTGFTPKDKPRVQWEGFNYGILVDIDQGDAMVRYKYQKYARREKLSDVIYVSAKEWKLQSSDGCPIPEKVWKEHFS